MLSNNSSELLSFLDDLGAKSLVAETDGSVVAGNKAVQQSFETRPNHLDDLFEKMEEEWWLAEPTIAYTEISTATGTKSGLLSSTQSEDRYIVSFLDESDLGQIEEMLDRRIRERKAEFLHDNLANTLHSISKLSELVDSNSPVIDQISELSLRAEKAFRKFENEVRPASTFTFEEMIFHVRSLAENAGAEIKISATGSPDRLTENQRNDLLETLRELVRNSYQHAESPEELKIEASVAVGDSETILRVSDNGPGLTDRPTALRYPKSRAERLSGSISIESGEDGTTVKMQFPTDA